MSKKPVCGIAAQLGIEPAIKRPAHAKLVAAAKKKAMGRHKCQEDFSDKVMTKFCGIDCKDVVERTKAACEAFEEVGGLYKASGCNGSNVASPTTLAFFKALKVHVPVHEISGAEESPYKKGGNTCICQLCGVCEHCMFENVGDLCKELADCVVHGEPCPVPSVASPMTRRPFISEEGFTCKLFSCLFNGRKDLSEWGREGLLVALFEERVGSTGIISGAMLGFACRCRPGFILLGKCGRRTKA